MTTVYGVTKYGARLQIMKQLKGKCDVLVIISNNFQEKHNKILILLLHKI